MNFAHTETKNYEELGHRVQCYSKGGLGDLGWQRARCSQQALKTWSNLTSLAYSLPSHQSHVGHLCYGNSTLLIIAIRFDVELKTHNLKLASGVFNQIKAGVIML